MILIKMRTEKIVTVLIQVNLKLCYQPYSIRVSLRLEMYNAVPLYMT